MKKLLWGLDYGKKHTYEKSEINIIENTTICFEHFKNYKYVLESVW